jgi:hypothetical protein
MTVRADGLRLDVNGETAFKMKENEGEVNIES